MSKWSTIRTDFLGDLNPGEAIQLHNVDRNSWYVQQVALSCHSSNDLNLGNF